MERWDPVRCTFPGGGVYAANYGGKEELYCAYRNSQCATAAGFRPDQDCQKQCPAVIDPCNRNFEPVYCGKQYCRYDNLNCAAATQVFTATDCHRDKDETATEVEIEEKEMEYYRQKKEKEAQAKLKEEAKESYYYKSTDEKEEEEEYYEYYEGSESQDEEEDEEYYDYYKGSMSQAEEAEARWNDYYYYQPPESDDYYSENQAEEPEDGKLAVEVEPEDGKFALEVEPEDGKFALEVEPEDGKFAVEVEPEEATFALEERCPVVAADDPCTMDPQKAVFCMEPMPLSNLADLAPCVYYNQKCADTVGFAETNCCPMGNVGCSPLWDPVLCSATTNTAGSAGSFCPYENLSCAQAAGYSYTECSQTCPAPAAGNTVNDICNNSLLDPVACGPYKCQYSNPNCARLAGFNAPVDCSTPQEEAFAEAVSSIAEGGNNATTAPGATNMTDSGDDPTEFGIVDDIDENTTTSTTNETEALTASMNEYKTASGAVAANKRVATAIAGSGVLLIGVGLVQMIV